MLISNKRWGGGTAAGRETFDRKANNYNSMADLQGSIPLGEITSTPCFETFAIKS